MLVLRGLRGDETKRLQSHRQHPCAIDHLSMINDVLLLVQVIKLLERGSGCYIWEETICLLAPYSGIASCEF